MSVIYIHESIVTGSNSDPTQIPISFLDNIAPYNEPTLFVDISFCDLQSVNSYLNNQITNFSNTFSVNNNATIKITFPNSITTNKTMQQRYLDLFAMQMAFSGILSKLSTNIYGDDYLNLQKMEQQNIDLRNSLNNKLDYIFENDPNEIFKKAQMDGTIYSSILWVILAIVLIYYIFIRIQ